MRDLLVILNPRNIPACMESFDALDIDRCYLTGYYETQLAEAQQEVPRDYDRYVVIADDCIVTQLALDEVLRYTDDKRPVVTGYCTLDSDRYREWTNLSRKPILDPVPRIENYEFIRVDEVARHLHPLLPTSFVGFALTAMTNEIWHRFPFKVCEPYKAQTDYSLSYRLTMAGVPMWAAKEALVTHVKERWNESDIAPEKRLLIGQVEPEVRMQVRTTA